MSCYYIELSFHLSSRILYLEECACFSKHARNEEARLLGMPGLMNCLIELSSMAWLLPFWNCRWTVCVLLGGWNVHLGWWRLSLVVFRIVAVPNYSQMSSLENDKEEGQTESEYKSRLYHLSSALCSYKPFFSCILYIQLALLHVGYLTMAILWQYVNYKFTPSSA